MDRRALFTRLASLAREQVKEHGGKLASKHGRPLGEKLAAHLSRVGVEKGLLQQPLDLDAIMRRLKELRASGAISGDELRELAKQLKDHAMERLRKR